MRRREVGEGELEGTNVAMVVTECFLVNGRATRARVTGGPCEQRMWRRASKRLLAVSDSWTEDETATSSNEGEVVVMN